MPKKYVLIIAGVLIVAGFLAVWVLGDRGQPRIYSGDKWRPMVEDWIQNSSPTYVFDGMNLTFIEGTVNLDNCIDCFQFKYSFESRQAGYGDRTGQILAQVITPHIIVVTIESGKITSAITDGVFDELKGEMKFRQ